MSHYILDNFTKYTPLEINIAVFHQYLQLMYAFETRQKHPEALNSPYIGLVPIYWTTQDTNNLFDILDVDMKEFKKVVKKTPSIDTSRKVTSDLFNLLTIYTTYSTIISDLRDDEKLMLTTALLKMLHYKFFTSLVVRRFQYGSNPAIMKATINSLSAKFDLIRYGTWKAVIEARVEDMLAKNSIHYKTFHQFVDDKAVLYILSDAQTRIRNKIRIITNKYHEIKQSGDLIQSTSMTKEIEGEKIFMDQAGTLDSMTLSISNQVLNINDWINSRYVTFCVKMFNNINESLFRTFLQSFSQYASLQNRKQTLDLIKQDKNKTVYLGIRVLIKTLLQKIYRICIQNRTNLKNKQEILMRARNTFAASRMQEQDILDLKDSVSLVVGECVHITRDATLASLRIAFICYLVLKSFEYL